MSGGPGVARWDTESTIQLIKFWGEPDIQAAIGSTYRNEETFRHIQSRMLNEAGLDFTLQTCRNKIKSLKKEYREARRNFEQNGTGKERFRFYDLIDQVIGDTIELYPERNSAASEKLVVQQDADGPVDDEEASLTQAIENALAAKEESQESHQPTTSSTRSAGTSSYNFRNSSLPRTRNGSRGFLGTPSRLRDRSRPVQDGFPRFRDDALTNADTSHEENGPHRKKRRLIGPVPCMASRELASTVDQMVDKFVAYQREAQEKFLAYEEKRHKSQLEWEEKQKKEEREERKAEREHQLKMLQTFAQMLSNSNRQQGLPPTLDSLQEDKLN